MANSQDLNTLETLTELRRSLVHALESVSRDSRLKNKYPLLTRDFRNQGGLVRELTSALQSACLQEEREFSHDSNPPRSRRERMGLEKDQNSW